MVPIPLAKLGALLLKTLLKPVAKSIKTNAKIHPFVEKTCLNLGQFHNRMSWRLHLLALQGGIRNYKVKPLEEKQAIEIGADFLGEILLFNVAAIILTAEYTRSSIKSQEIARKEAENKQKANDEIENRFNMLDNRINKIENILENWKQEQNKGNIISNIMKNPLRKT